MEFLLNGSKSLRQVLIPDEERLVCALGCFDGVHIGHRALIREVLSDRNGLIGAVWTFSEPLAKPFIEKVEDRLHILSELGVKYAVCESYEKVKDMSAMAFLEYLYSKLGVRRIVCGTDFRFGKDREGDVEFIKQNAPDIGMEVTVIEPVYADIGGERVKASSTTIRSFISEGKMREADVLLGRRFSVTGVVVSGNNLGRTIQVPTLNQRFEKGRIIPKHGVYETVCVADSIRYPAITNVGTRPTVSGGSTEINCETHIIGQKLDLYGSIVSVDFYDYVREEKKFDSLQALRDQIEKDIAQSVSSFRKRF